MYIPVDSEYNEKLLLKRKDAANIETWDELQIYDKVSCARRLRSRQRDAQKGSPRRAVFDGSFVRQSGRFQPVCDRRNAATS